MQKRKLILSAIFLAGLLVIGAASAADIACMDNTTNAIDSQPDLALGTTDNHDNLKISKDINLKSQETTQKSFTDLNDIINIENPTNTTIYLSENYTYNSSRDSGFVYGVVIDRNITIYGNGITLDGAHAARIFKVTAGCVALHDITFVNGKVTGRTPAEYNGGAIYWSSSNVIILNCYFINNTARYGGANYFENGLVDSNINATFIDNTVEDSGGANDFKGTLTNVNITGNYIGNTAKILTGGANRFRNALTNVNITGNYNNNAATTANGGANDFMGILTNVTITGNYTGNTAYKGGANDFKGTLTNVTITGNYNNNAATTAGGGANDFGYILTNVTINGNFTGNTAQGSGGANYFGYILTNVTIKGNYADNTATTGNGGVNFFWNTLTNTIINGNYMGNTAQGNGGANYFGGKITNTIITGDYNNNTSNASKGGANFFWDTLTNTSIIGNYYNNKANGTEEHDGGGANYFNQTLTNVTITGDYTGNTALYGGANYYYKALSHVNITGNYYNNTAKYSGGANNFLGTLNNVNISGNYINNPGDSAIHIENSDNSTTIRDSIFLNNVANIKLESGNITLINSWFGNNASNYNETPDVVNVAPENWLFLNATVDYDKSSPDPTANITFRLYSFNSKTNETSDYDASRMPPIKLSITANHGKVNQSIALLGQSVKYTPEGEKAIMTASIENAICTFELDAPRKDPNLSAKGETISYGENATIIVVLPGDATGNVTIGTETVKLFKGTARAVIANLPVGNNTIPVTYSGDEKYNPIETAVNVTVNRANSTVTIPEINMDYGESVNVTVTATGAVSITAKINGKDVPVSGFSISISGLNATNYTLTVTTVPDENHTEVTETSNITVNKVNSTLIFDDIVVFYGCSTTVAVTAEGAMGITATLDGRIAIFKGYDVPIPAVGAGIHNLTVTAIPDRNHYEVSKTGKVTVLKQNTTMEITVPQNMTVCENSTVKVRLPRDATGNVTLKVDGKEIDTVPVARGGAELTLTGLSARNHTVKIAYSGDGNYNPVSKTVDIVVSKQNITPDITVPSKITFGDDSNVDVKLPGDATGNITFSIDCTEIDTVPLSDGIASVNLTKLSVGNHTIEITYSGDEKYNPIETAVNVTVNGANSTVTIPEIKMDYEESVNVTVTADGAVSVTAKINGKDVPVNGFTISISGLNATTYVLTVTTVPDENHTETTETSNITVNKVNSTLIVDDIVVAYGCVTTVNVTGIGTEGIYANFDGEMAIFKGYNVPIPVAGIGNHNLTVYAVPDNNHNAVSKTVKVTVVKLNATVDISMPQNMTVGENSTVEVTLPDDAEGNITLKVDGNEIATSSVDDGSAELTLTGLSAGNHTAEIVYSGDDYYNPVSKTVDIEVSKQDVTPDIAVPSDIRVSDNSTVEVTLPVDAEGNVTLKVDGKEIATDSVVNGSAELALGDITAGNHTVEITYTGDDKYSAAKAAKEITVSKQNATEEIDIPSEIVFGDDSNVDVKLPGDAAGNVTFSIDGTEIETVPLANGTASVTLSELPVGNHTVEISYSGDGKYNPTAKTATLAVNRQSSKLTGENVAATYNINKDLVITLTDSKGNPISNATVNVVLKTDENYTTDEDGQIIIRTYSLGPETYTAKIEFKGNEKYTQSNATVSVVVKKATPKIAAKAKTFKTTTKTKKYTITLKDNTGKAIANAKVTLKVGGKTYYATTNIKGKATFKITKLSKKGKYSAVITYKANKYYNKITKKVKITVKSVWKTVSKGSKNHVMVKKIQKALKANGYYLSYKGHYLMVDGIFHDCTERSLKEFQKAKGLKVTGRVDYKTAQKLKLVK